MSSTFFGLNIAKSGLFVSQRGLNVISHNVANANTPGFSRQRLDFRQTTPDILPASNGMIGTGVDSESVIQIRNEFTDLKIRNEMTTQGEWTFKREMYGLIEAIFNEPTDSGIRSVVDAFYEAVHELNKNPENLTTRALVRQRSIAVTESLGAMHKKLVKAQEDIDFQLKSVVSQINGYADQITELNKIIYQNELDGSTANDIRDQRNLLVDKLSKLINIDYYEDGNNRFHVLVSGSPLVSHFNANEVTMTPREYKKNPDDAYRLVDVGWETGATFNATGGEIKGILDMRDGMSAESKGFPYYVDRLNAFSDRFFSEVNRIHMNGFDMEGNKGTMLFTIDNMKASDFEEYLMTKGLDGHAPIDLTAEVTAGVSPSNTVDKNNEILAKNIRDLYENNPQYAAKSIKYLSDGRYYLVDRISANRFTVSREVDSDLNKIAASDTLEGVPGNGQNALNIANMRHNIYMYSWGSPDDYVKSLISNLGVDSAEAIRIEKNQNMMIIELENRRQSVMGVSLDEEMSEMIKFQHTYSANARMMTALDELLDLVVNRLGLVGR
ncbi:MAG: flagellar hook-associated protein FlgK [Clostridiales bacterium]|nr:MAG: flagellar hook-associated protein FlgK [Clostridiales bacterium]